MRFNRISTNNTIMLQVVLSYYNLLTLYWLHASNLLFLRGAAFILLNTFLFPFLSKLLSIYNIGRFFYYRHKST